MNDASEVKLHFLDYWRIIKIRAGLVVLTFLLVVVTAGVTTYFLPREYFSKTKMEVRPDVRAIDVYGNGNRAYVDPTFIPTQFQIIQSKEILEPVIDKLNLLETWSQREGVKRLPMETIYAKLLRMLDLKEVRNTGLIDIGVYSIDNQEAANIANTIASVYMESRTSLQKGSVDRALAQLRDELGAQRKRVADAASEVAEIRERDNIVDSDPENSNAVISTADRNIVAIEQQLHDKQLKVTEIKEKFKRIKDMKPEELREVLRTLNIPDEQAQKMITSLQDATAEEKKLYASGLGLKHPRLMAVRSQKEYFLEQLNNALISVHQNQASSLAIEEEILKNLETAFEKARESQIQDKQKTIAYSSAKARYLNEKKIFEAGQLKYSTERVEQTIDLEPVRIWDKAVASNYPAKPKVPAYMLLAAVIGLVFGVGLAFFIEYLDTSVKTLDDVEKYLRVPVLAVIPRDVATLIKSTGEVPDAEAYRILRANVEFNKPNRSANTFTLVSGGPGEGKSTTLNNLAYICAQGGYNVLVVDADIRRPSQHRFFEMENNVGLVDFLRGRADLDELIKPTKLDNLSFLPSGQLPDESVGILNSQRMVDLIARVKQTYDLVFFDSPPILGVSDGSVLASECDVTIMVIQHRRFPRVMLQRVKQAVAQAGGALIGVVLNNVDSRHDEGYAYYNGYNEYYARQAGERSSRPATAAAPTPRRSIKGAQEPAPVPATANGETKKTATRAVDQDDY
jgi:capsular exopolysaccharide synthesis family protein